MLGENKISEKKHNAFKNVIENLKISVKNSVLPLTNETITGHVITIKHLSINLHRQNPELGFFTSKIKYFLGGLEKNK